MAVIERKKPNGAPRTSRMLKPGQFGAVLSLPRERQIRCASHWFSLVAGEFEDSVKFGLTVGKKNAPLAVQRNLVKRILREAYRVRASSVANAARQANLEGLYVSLRLRRSLKEADFAGKRSLKVLLHQDAAALVDKFLAVLEEKSKRHKMS